MAAQHLILEDFPIFTFLDENHDDLTTQSQYLVKIKDTNDPKRVYLAKLIHEQDITKYKQYETIFPPIMISGERQLIGNFLINNHSRWVIISNQAIPVTKMIHDDPMVELESRLQSLVLDRRGAYFDVWSHHVKAIRWCMHKICKLLQKLRDFGLVYIGNSLDDFAFYKDFGMRIVDVTKVAPIGSYDKYHSLKIILRLFINAEEPTDRGGVFGDGIKKTFSADFYPSIMFRQCLAYMNENTKGRFLWLFMTEPLKLPYEAFDPSSKFDLIVYLENKLDWELSHGG